MSISYLFSGLGKLIFSTRKIAKINKIIANSIFIKDLIIELPMLGCLLYLSCILFWFYLNLINKTYL